MPASRDETAVAHQRRPLIFQRVTRRERRPATASTARVGTTCGTTAFCLSCYVCWQPRPDGLEHLSRDGQRLLRFGWCRFPRLAGVSEPPRVLRQRDRAVHHGL